MARQELIKELRGSVFSSVGSIGLFWFSEDYSSITRVEGLRKLKMSDIVKGSRVAPDSVHAEYSMARSAPRGMVIFEGGMFHDYVGEDCPIDPVALVKKAFGLERVSDARFKVTQHFHWNT